RGTVRPSNRHRSGSPTRTEETTMALRQARGKRAVGVPAGPSLRPARLDHGPRPEMPRHGLRPARWEADLPQALRRIVPQPETPLRGLPQAPVLEVAPHRPRAISRTGPAEGPGAGHRLPAARLAEPTTAVPPRAVPAAAEVQAAAAGASVAAAAADAAEGG